MTFGDRKSVVLASLACGTAVVVFTIAARIPWPVVLVSLSLLAALTVLGSAAVRRLGPTDIGGFQSMFLGAALGMALGRLAFATTTLLIGPAFQTAAITTALLILAATLLHATTPRSAWHQEDTADLSFTLLLTSAVLLLTSGPFSAIASPTEGGFAFVRYFQHDFMHHAAIAAELSRSVPPTNPYFAGEPLHYYWFSHVFPSIIMQLTNSTAIAALSSVLPLNVLVFVGALIATTRSFVAARLPRYGAATVGLLSYSYLGFFFFFRELGPAQFRDWQSSYTFFSHSWFRDFLFEPHAVAALTLCLFALSVMTSWTNVTTIRTRIAIGIALGLTLITDSFVGGVLIVWFSALCFWRALRNGSWRSEIEWATSLVVALLIIGFAYSIQLLPPGSQPIVLSVHNMAKIAPAYLVVELGPIFLLGAGGLTLAWRSRATHLDALILLFAIGLGIGFFAQLPADDAIVIRKAIKVVQIPLVIAIGYTLLWANARPPVPRALVIIIAASGAITLASDLAFFTRVIPVPRSTTILSSDELKAYEWLRASSPKDAYIQDFGVARPGRPYRSHTATWINGLTERRTLFANYETPYLLQVDAATLEQRRRLLESLSVAKGDDAVALISALPAHYLIVDDARNADLTVIHDLERAGLLETVFSSGSVSVKYFAGSTRNTSHLD